MNPAAAQLVVIAKTPVPGQVKTRLTPPYTAQQAALLAAAALTDTLAAGSRGPFARSVLALARPARRLRPLADPARWLLPACFEVAGQRGDGLDERIAAAMSDAYAGLRAPVVLIGMDTPQVTAAALGAAARPLACGQADAAFGPAADGGFWLLGLRTPDPCLVRGVPMSSAHTGRVQLRRLRAAGLRVHLLPELTDVDTAADASVVAGEAPGSRFAAVLRGIGQYRPAPVPIAGGRPACSPPS